MKQVEHKGYEVAMETLPDYYYEEETQKVHSRLYYVCYLFYILITYSYFELYGIDFYKHLDMAYLKAMGITWVGHVAIYIFKYFTRT